MCGVCFVNIFFPHIAFFVAPGRLCFAIVAFPGYTNMCFIELCFHEQNTAQAH